jgi:ectoine hydroxylase-related dioxygenase (phytanoyl-CoA dioxygenase family)
MGKFLTEAEIAQFRAHGWLAPLRAISGEEAGDYAGRIEEYEAGVGEDANRSLKIKAHLAMPALVALGRNPHILDALEDLIGPDILLFGSSLFAKPGDRRSFVSWHQDSAYFGLDPHEEITAWVAFTPSTGENGALQVLPGSHDGPDLVHEETFAADNMLARGQSLAVADAAEAVTITLAPGEFSLHHERTVHGSKPNESGERRIGFAFFYIPTHVRSTIGRRSALLVRGSDRYGYWDSDPLPTRDLDPVALAAMRAAWKNYREPAAKAGAKASDG